MMKKVLPLLVGVGVVAVVGVGGYFGYQQYTSMQMSKANPEQNIKQSFEKISDVKSFSFDLQSNTTTAKSSAAAGANVILSVTGKVSVADMENPMVDAMLKVSVQPTVATEQPMAAEVAVRAANSNAYLNIMKLNVQGLPVDVSPYVNKWISFTTGADTKKQTPAEMTKEDAEKMAKIKQLFQGANFFTVKQNLGVMTEAGVMVNRYVVRIDDQKTRDLLREILKVTGEELDLSQRGQLMEMVTVLSQQDVTIGVDAKGYLREISGARSDKDMSSTLALHFSNINEPVTVAEPKADMTIDQVLQQVLGLPPGTKLQDLIK